MNYGLLWLSTYKMEEEPECLVFILQKSDEEWREVGKNEVKNHVEVDVLN